MNDLSSEGISIVWLRRDLRLHDHTALYHALHSGLPVLPLFIFDRQILDLLPDRTDRRVEFIHHELSQIQNQLKALGKSMLVLQSDPVVAWQNVLSGYPVRQVHFNKDYEPYAKTRDSEITELLEFSGIQVFSYKDQCIFEEQEILNGQGKPYTVFTPYSRKWKERLHAQMPVPCPSEQFLDRLLSLPPQAMPGLEEMGFKAKGLSFPGKELKEDLLKNYANQRNFPFLPATSRLGLHLRFGTLSIRELVRKAVSHSETWLNELIWRDFYFMILANFPHVADRAFKPAYDRLEWRNNEEEFKAWCEGKTGYPIVDAGMRELNETGFMHNRVRMIVASFLTKHLLIDWKWGEAYFAQKLLDFELSSNNGGWQWAAGSGTDAAPYFRIFNPMEQTKKFDQNMEYIQKWVPEWASSDYPKPIVDHVFARKRCLEAYKKALG
jgi:deoxyribodipyrimidine photo-lyase